VYTPKETPIKRCEYCQATLEKPRPKQRFCPASTGSRCRHLWHRRERAKGKQHLCICGEKCKGHRPRKPAKKRKECEVGWAMRDDVNELRRVLYDHHQDCKECGKEA